MADHYPVAQDLTPSRGEMYANLMRVLGYLQQVPEAARNLVAGRGQDPNLGRWLMQLMASDPTGGPMPMAAPARIAYSTPKALELGQAGLRMLPERIQQFLLRHPRAINVTTEGGAERGSFHYPRTPDTGPVTVKFAPESGPTTAAHEFLHAADWLRDPDFMVGTKAAETPVGQQYGKVLSKWGYPATNRAAETFAATPFAIYGSKYPQVAEATWPLVQDPQSRNALLEALAQFTP